MATERMEFPGATGARLSGILHIPDEQPRGSVLMAHCFTCSKDLHTMTRLGRGLSDAGYAVLRFDFTGLGESGGEFSATSVSSNVSDLTHAAMALLERGYGPCGLLGHSLGGAAAILAAARLKTVRSVVVIGAPSTPGHVKELFADQEADIERDGSAVVSIGGRSFRISREFLNDLSEHDSLQRIASLGRPLCVVHAVDDRVVAVTEGERIFAAAAQPKMFVPLLEADHLLTSRAAAEQALHHVVDWFDRTL